jgi:hypothetical protein
MLNRTDRNLEPYTLLSFKVTSILKYLYMKIKIILKILEAFKMINIQELVTLGSEAVDHRLLYLQ